MLGIRLRRLKQKLTFSCHIAEHIFTKEFRAKRFYSVSPLQAEDSNVLIFSPLKLFGGKSIGLYLLDNSSLRRVSLCFDSLSVEMMNCSVLARRP